MNTKVCIKCNKEKSLDEYNNRKDSKDGKRADCKECHNNMRREYRYNNRERRREYMKKYRIDNPNQVPNWIKKNYDRYLENSRRWKKQNPDKVKRHKRDTRRRRLSKDPQFRLKENIRRLLLLTLDRGGYLKKSKTQQILGCSYEEFVEHIESQFVDGMGWGNKGEWELDHIIPISSAVNEEEVCLLNHYTNFQPLWREYNRRKADSYNEEDKKRFLDELKSIK